MKLLLDTDIGSDIDDAVCLAYLLARQDCDLLGITTVTGEGHKRAMLASALCKNAGREVPIFIGAEKPLLIEPIQNLAPQAAALSRWPHESHFPAGQAVAFLRETIRQNPGEIMLLTVGPLTNIALLFHIDPQIPALLKGIVTMGGVFFSKDDESLEWNILLDPHAAAMVYRTAVPAHYSVGLDVTEQVRMEAKRVREKFAIAPLRPVLDFAEVWFRERSEITFHDALAAATLFDTQLCNFESGLVDVEVQDRSLEGKTHWYPGHTSTRHHIAVTVDRERFFDHYFSVFTAG